MEKCITAHLAKICEICYEQDITCWLYNTDYSQWSETQFYHNVSFGRGILCMSNVGTFHCNLPQNRQQYKNCKKYVTWQ
jgi:hypothetical protein